MPRTWIAREMYQQLRKREVEMGVGDWEVEISRPIDCKKWHFVALFFIQRMALVNGVVISRPIVRKRSFVVLLFVFNSQNEVYLWNKAIKRRRTFSNNEKGAFCLNNTYYLIFWSVGSYFFTIAMPNQVMYYQKGRGKVSGDQQIAVSACHCPWAGRFIFNDLQ